MTTFREQATATEWAYCKLRTYYSEHHFLLMINAKEALTNMRILRDSIGYKNEAITLTEHDSPDGPFYRLKFT